MAQLKDLIISGSSRVLGTSYASEFVGNLTGTATRATNDSNGDNIRNTYVASVTVDNGVATITKGNGSSSTYSVGGGGSSIELYDSTGQNTDGAMTQKATSDAISNIPYVSDVSISGQIATITTNGSASATTFSTQDTTYSNGTGLDLSGTEFSLSTVGSASTAGPSANVTGTDGSTVSIPRVIIDEYGRVTSLGEYTLTNKDTTYSDGTGLDLTGTEFSLSTVGSASTVGPTEDISGTNGSTVSIPEVAIDEYGRVVSLTSRTLTNKNTTYSNGTGLDLTGTVFSLSTLGSASTEGPTGNVSGTNNSTISIPQVIIDEYGRVSGLTSYTLTNKDTTYSNGTGISLSGTTFSLSTIGSASTAGPTGNVSGTNNSTISIPQVIIDEYGRVTSLSDKTLTNKDTTYSNGTGLNLSGTTFSLSTVVAAATVGPSDDVTGNNNSTVSIPQVTIDTYGRVTALTSRTLTCKNTTYSNASLGQGYGTCGTAAATAAKAVTLSNYALTTGGIVAVKFTYAVPANATLNVNSKGAKAIKYKGNNIIAGLIDAGDVASFIYDGSYYHLISVTNVATATETDYGEET